MSVTTERAALVARARELRGSGLLQREIAEAMGLSRSYVSDLFSDPNRSKTLERRAGYAGTCIGCGAPTCGSEGRALAPKRCLSCTVELQKANKYWTAERVIEAIQRWAQTRGKPPTATDWVRQITDPDGFKYPNLGSVYRSTSATSTAPFDLWADAIESAGFPRPYTGSYKRRGKERTMSNNTRTYLIFAVNDDESLSFVGERDATTNAGAIEAFTTTAGKYASCPKGSLVQFDVAPRLIARRIGEAA